MTNLPRPLTAVALSLCASALVWGVGCSQPRSSPAPQTKEDASETEKAPSAASQGGAAKSADTAPASHDWTQMRGPEQTGVSREKGLPESFSTDESDKDSNLIWKQPYGGRSTPIIMNGRVYVINPTNEGVSEEERLSLQERVMCFDANTGKVLWEHKFNVFHTDIVAARVGWTNVVGDPETGNVYAHGVQGLLFCFDGETGKVKWQKSLTEEFGRVSGYGGRVTSPIIDEDLLILGMINSNWGEYARGGNRFMAMDKKTGDIVWWSQTDLPVKFTYASLPTVGVINGQRLLISGGGDGAIHAFKVRTGEKVWSYLFSAGGINPAPVVDGDFVYIGHGDENLEGGRRGMLVCLDGSQVHDGAPKVVWKDEGHLFKFASPVIHEGKIYAADENATLYCFEAKKGKRMWSYGFGRSNKGSPIWADGKLYLTAVGGEFHIINTGEKKAQRVFKTTVESRLPGVALEMNGGVAVANGRLYFMTSQDIYCIGLKGGKPQTDPIPAKPQEPKVNGNGKPAHLQVVPADVTLTPGESVTFKARLFDADGRLLRETPATWEVAPFLAPPPIRGQPAQPGPPPPMLQGMIAEDGKLTVSPKVPSQFGGVIAKADGLTGRARVRVAPVIPYSQDFEKVPDNRTPGGWINAQGKFLVKELPGVGKVLMKNNTNAAPPVARSNAYITLPFAKDYTIQAELMGTKKGNDMPDMGLVNCRYTLQLAGQVQQLRLLSWDALPRIDKGIVFAWKPNVWYSMKLIVEQNNGKAIVKGKVWEKGKEEPAQWTITLKDATPNIEGAAALYGYATGIEEKVPGTTIYYDNVKVTLNKKD